MNDERDGGWHLDKKVPISIIFVLLTQGVAGLWVIADIKKDVEVLKSQFVHQHELDERQDRIASDALNQVRAQLGRVEAKLDRLIEARIK